MPKADDEIERLSASADAVLWKYRDAPSIPELVYHYTTVDTATTIALTRKVWCSNVTYSNDPAEGEYGKELLDEVVPRDRDFRFDGLRKVIAGLQTYAASFSAAGDVLPQWRAYCRNGRGVAIGVDSEVLKRRTSMIFMRVLYDRNEQEQIVKDMLDVFRAPVLSSHSDTARLKELVGRLALYMVIVRSVLKNPAYESEREYRLFDVLPAEEPNPELHFRTTAMSAIPYLIADLSASAGENAAQPVRDIKLGWCLDSGLLSGSLKLFARQNALGFDVTRSRIRMRCD